MNSPPRAFDQPAKALRRASRTNLYLAATLIGGQSRDAVTVRNLSATGALVRSRQPLEETGPFTLVRGSLRAAGTLAWRDGRNAGMNFDEPIDLAQWAPGAPRAGQSAVDRIVAQSRDPVAIIDARGAAPVAPTSRPGLVTRIAEELAFTSRRLENLGSALANDSLVICRHAAQLQQLDIAMQTLAHLGRLLGADDPEAALASVGMEDLRRRLGRA